MGMEEKLNAEFDAWFAQLSVLATGVDLRPEEWTEAWFDGVPPSQAWAEQLRNE